MKTTMLLRVGVLGCLALACSACKSRTASAASSRSTEVPGSKPNVRLLEPLAEAEWTSPAGDPGNARFSRLSQIDVSNVGRLRVTSTASTGVTRGHEGQPLVVGGMMYVVTPFPNDLIAIDLAKPDLVKWRFKGNPDPRAVGVACCDVVNRGASYAEGKIIYNLLDGRTPRYRTLWTTRPASGESTAGETFVSATTTTSRTSTWWRRPAG